MTALENGLSKNTVKIVQLVLRKSVDVDVKRDGSCEVDLFGHSVRLERGTVIKCLRSFIGEKRRVSDYKESDFIKLEIEKACHAKAEIERGGE